MKVSIYIATSLDGYIAKPDHDLSWLDIVKAEGEDYGYSDFMSSIDCLLIGRNTYDTIRGFDFWPYEGKKIFVLTHRPIDPIRDEQPVSGSLRPIIEKLSIEGIKHIYLDGGATARLGLIEGVVTDLIVSVIPILLGSGISLWNDLGKEIHLQHSISKSFPSGLVQSSYRVQQRH